MANITISPNMKLPVPTVGEDPGEDWATNITGCMSAIDSHNHSSGQGVAITPSGLNINSDLPMANNNLITARSVRFTPQLTALALASDIGCLYVSALDLYYNDVSGNQVRITQGGTVTGSTGTITGLPSGTASASYAAGTFTFQGATSTPATMAVGPLVIGRAAASSKTVTLTPNAAQPSNYSMTFPTALPSAVNYVTLDNSGAIAYNSSGTTGTGAVVLATSPTITTPTFTGSTSGIISAATFVPTVTWNYVSGGTAAFNNITIDFNYIRVNNVVHVFGLITFQASAVTPTAIYNPSITIPIATASLQNVGSRIIPWGTTVTAYLQDVSNTAVKSSVDFIFGADVTTTTMVSYAYIVT